MARYYADRVAFSTATTGTGNITAGAALSDAFLDPDDTNIANGDNPILLIQEGLDFEICQATFVSAGPHFTRDTVIVSKIGGTVGTDKIDLQGSAVVRFVTPALLWSEILAGDAANVARSVLTTRGDLPYRGASDWTRLAKGNPGDVLTQGTDDPAWAAPAAPGISTGKAIAMAIVFG